MWYAVIWFVCGYLAATIMFAWVLWNTARPQKRFPMRTPREMEDVCLAPMNSFEYESAMDELAELADLPYPDALQARRMMVLELLGEQHRRDVLGIAPARRPR